MFDSAVTFDDLAWIKDQWHGKVVVKGVQNVDDAVKLADLGVDAVLLSNHGGRQLDSPPVPFQLLQKVKAAVGDSVAIHLDPGIMSGPEDRKCIAQGKSFAVGVY